MPLQRIAWLSNLRCSSCQSVVPARQTMFDNTSSEQNLFWDRHVRTSMGTVRVEDNLKYDAADSPQIVGILTCKKEASVEPLSSSHSKPPVTSYQR